MPGLFSNPLYLTETERSENQFYIKFITSPTPNPENSACKSSNIPHAWHSVNPQTAPHRHTALTNMPQPPKNIRTTPPDNPPQNSSSDRKSCASRIATSQAR